MDRVHQNLKEIFGFDAFRPGQLEVIEALLAGRPALAVFPTGAGKSLCYQLPALQLEGVTLVVSPLIALMKDQVDQLKRLGVAAEKLDSTLTSEETRAVYDRMADGSLKLLYVAPERLGNEGFRVRMTRARISMLAIDEAHCISAWGHNFRPDYLKIAAFAREQGIRRILALTATATPSVSTDVRDAFDIDPADHVQTGFHRPNLTLRVHRCSAEERVPRLVERLTEQAGGATIVYVTLQKTAERVAEELVRQGFAARPYHAGLKPDVRAGLQDDFMTNEVQIIVATIAFGMGIDKADIRSVYHVNLPKSLESYSQEIGRAGRDGQPSRCELFASGDDQTVLDNFSYGDTPTTESLHGMVQELVDGGTSFSVSQYRLSRDHDMRPLVVSTVLTYLELDGILKATGPFYAGYQVGFVKSRNEILNRFEGERRDFMQAVFNAGKMGRSLLTLSLDTVAAATDQPRARISTALNWLEQQGAITCKPSNLQHGFQRAGDVDVDALVARLAEQFEEREKADIDRTASVLHFAERGDCLTRALVGYFGEELENKCGHCGPCEGATGGPLPRAKAVTLEEADRALIKEVASEGHTALSHPRALARFLCGLTSPATQGRGGLQRDQRFGALDRIGFMEVLRETGLVISV